MPLSDDDFDAARTAWLRAAFDDDAWSEAMEWVTRATGGWASQLLGFSLKRGPVFQKVSGLSDDLLAAWEAYGGMDAGRNPRHRMAYVASSYNVLDESTFSSADEMRSSAIYNELYVPHDGPYVTAAKFDAIDDVHVAILGIRSARQGLADDTTKAAFQSLLPHIKAAVRVRETLEARATRLLAGALDSVDVAAFLCREDGRIVQCTPRAEAILSPGGYLYALKGVLTARHPQDDIALKTAMARAGSRRSPPEATSVLLRASGLSPRLAEVAPLPRLGQSAHDTIHLGATVMVALATPRAMPAAGLVQRAFGLTEAEAEIALALADGQTIERIAETRETSVATVRTQVKSVLAKTEVSTQAQLVGLLARFNSRPL